MVSSTDVQSVFKAAQTLHIVVLPDMPRFTLVEISDGYLISINIPEHELAGKTLFDVLPETLMDQDGTSAQNDIRSCLEQVLANKTHDSLDMLKYQIRAGSRHVVTRYWSLQISPVLDENDEIDFILLTPQDITAQILAEQESERVRQKLHQELQKKNRLQEEHQKEKDLADSLSDSMPGTFYLFNKYGKMIRWNKNTEILTGYTTEEVAQMSPLNFIAEEDRTKVRLKIAEGFIRGKKELEATALMKDGGKKPFLFSSTIVRYNNETCLMGIGLDLSEHEKMESQIKSSLKEKEVLLNEVHHRVKNNLAIISSLLQMQARTSPNNKLKGALAESEGRIQAMAMIHELLYQHEDFSQLNFGEYIEKLLQQVKGKQTIDKVIRTEVNADPVFLDISTAVPCALIINELLTNAYKHAFQGLKQGNISISLKQNGKTLTLEVYDDGIGLPPNSGDETLGMSLIHGLAKQVGGRVRIRSEHGTTFTITFPADSQSQA